MANIYQDSTVTEQQNPNREPQPAATAAEAAAIAGVGVGFRGTYGGAGGQAAQDYVNYQYAQQQYQQEQQRTQQQKQQIVMDVSGRPGYYDPGTLGDTRTQQLLRMADINKIMFAQMGIDVNITREQLTGSILEGQRKAAESTPGLRDDRFYLNELQKWGHNPIEESSEYHKKALATGIQQAANPLENRGDVALAFEKAGNVKDDFGKTYAFNPNVKTMIGVLPEGQGTQEYAWRAAVTGERPPVDFMPGVRYLNAQVGRQGVYGSLYGGIPDTVRASPVSPAPTTETKATGLPAGVRFTGTIEKVGSVGQPGQQPGGKDILGIGATASGLEGATGGIQFAEPVRIKPTSEWTPVERFWKSASDWGAAEFGFIGASTDTAIGIGTAILTLGMVEPPKFFGKTGQDANTQLIKDTETAKQNAIREANLAGRGLSEQEAALKSLAVGNVTEGVWTGRPNTLAQQRAELESIKSGNVVEGKWVGPTELLEVYNAKVAGYNVDLARVTEEQQKGYDTYKSMYDTYSKNVEKYNLAQQNITEVERAGLKSGAYVIRNGQVIINPDQQLPYGEFSKWGIGAKQWMLGKLGYTEEQLEAYGVQQAAKPAAIPNMWEGLVYGFGKQVVTKPAETAALVGAGAEIYVATAGVGLGLQSLAAPTAVTGTAAEGALPTAGWLSRGASTLLKVGGSPIVKYGVPAYFIGSSEYHATEGLTQPPVKAAQSTGQLGAQFTALTAGAIGAGAIGKGYEYIDLRFEEKPMMRQTLEAEYRAVVKPEVQVPSGVGGELQAVVSKTIETQPSITVFGKEIAFPRVFEPVKRVSTTETTVLGRGDLGRLLPERLVGTEAQPTTVLRRVEATLEEYRSQPLAGGEGTLKTAQVMLPRTIEEYMRMAAADVKITGMPQETIAASLMADAARVAEPVTGYRELSVSVPKGTPIEDAFTWNVMKEGGKQIEFSSQVLEDYFGSMKVVREGGGISDYRVDITRDITEQGVLKGGSYDVTGAQVPEAKIVRQLQEVSRGLQPGDVEYSYAFDRRGNLISSTRGQEGTVDTSRSIDAVGHVEGPGSLAHTHPTRFTDTLLRNIKDDIVDTLKSRDITDITDGYTRALFDEVAIQAKGLDKYPSARHDMAGYSMLGDIFVEPHAITAEYIVTPRGVSIMREPTVGWGIWSDIGLRSPEYINYYTAADIARIKTQGGLEFVGKNKPYQSPGITERIPDASVEMKAAYPVGVRAQFIDMIDRIVLKDPNLEFIREQQFIREKSLLESGSNLGRGTGGTTMGSGRMVQIQPAQAAQPSIATAQPIDYRISRPAPDYLEPLAKPERVFAAPQEQVSLPERVLAITPSPMQKLIVSPQIQQKPKIEPAFAIISGQTYVPVQSPLKDYARAFTMITAPIFSTRFDQIPDYTTAQIPMQGVYQTPIQGQRVDQLPIQDQIQRQIPQMPQPQLPYTEPPWKPTIRETPGFLFPPIPWLPSGGGAPDIRKRRPRSFWELFPVGLDISFKSGWLGVTKRPHAKPKKGRLIPKSMLTPIKKKKKGR